MSINSVSARLVTEYGSPGEVVSLLRRAGVTSDLQSVPAISLGAGGELSPMEMASAFTTFANNGMRTESYYKLRIEDQRGNVLYEDKNNHQASEVVDPEVAHELTYMMQQVVNAGNAARIRTIFTSVEAAGKTGTTNDNADAWFVGYTPQLLAAVWIGFDDQRINFDPIGTNGQGGRAAAPIWAKLMQKIYNDPTLPYRQRSFNYKIMQRKPEDFEFDVQEDTQIPKDDIQPSAPNLWELEKEDQYVPQKKENVEPNPDQENNEPLPNNEVEPRYKIREPEKPRQRQEPPKPSSSNPLQKSPADDRRKFHSDEPKTPFPNNNDNKKIKHN
jgi:membrane peptidoglycan carboxypeptidase